MSGACSSAPRWSNLAFNTEFDHRIRQKVLKKVCPTRWEARHESVSALKERYVDVLKSLTFYSLTSKKAEERCIAVSLKKKMESFEFVLMLGLWERVLRSLHGTSKTLQQHDIDLQVARNRLNDSFSSIQNLRDDYTNIVKYAKEMCKKLNITESNFKIKIFLPLIDTVLNQLRVRFESLKEVCDVFEFLKPESIIKSKESKLIKSCYDFVLLYKSDVGSELVSQILSLKEIIVNNNLKSISNLAIFIVQHNFSTSYSEVLAACILFLTLPVTVAIAEWSFSKLKLIKNYLRNSMGQTRLSNIAVLNIEQHRTAKLSLDNIISQFSNLKARRMKF
ncbi:52 kDa repressor of the inhibitor of the protein kinase-like [Acyrthosiphon pisum]|uniref:HAT C-terminal dimerisation domain-containing protein n=1 Tax=Acyrthosiphon pisum TaxID=7029 RepID=A0A8R2NM45_ACYPI|nr:52 kDa repressor of the inhibitor of the protein kinase-like [Acyrthosiphon pisum]